jgi:hypothetical protein
MKKLAIKSPYYVWKLYPIIPTSLLLFQSGDESALSQPLFIPPVGKLRRCSGSTVRGARVLGVEGGFLGRKFACNSKNSQIGVGQRLIN